jgi:hypothetical protein
MKFQVCWARFAHSPARQSGLQFGPHLDAIGVAAVEALLQFLHLRQDAEQVLHTRIMSGQDQTRNLFRPVTFP